MGPRTDLDFWKNDGPQSPAQNILTSPWSFSLSPGHYIDWAVSFPLGLFSVTKKSKCVLKLKHRFYLKLRIMYSVYVLFSCLSDNNEFNFFPSKQAVKFYVCVTVHHWYNNINSQLDATITYFIDNHNQLDMFRAIISPILRSITLCLQLVVYCTGDTACWQYRRCIIRVFTVHVTMLAVTQAV